MKRLVLIMATFFIVGSQLVHAQLRDVPASVTNSFKAKFPDAKDIKWSDKVTSFQATFLSGGHTYEARFDNDGNFKESEKAISFDDLPAPVKETFNGSKFKDWNLRTVAEIQTSDGSTEYRIYLKDKTVNRKYLFYDASGKLLRDEYKI